MTAEIAILNKTAVALATDSAITISAGQTEEKIFDSGDKLFELSCANPIGIMIYNDMQFAEIPLPTIIKDFRDECPSVDRVEEAADLFLKYLDDIARDSGPQVQGRSLRRIIDPILERMDERFKDSLRRYVMKDKEPEAEPDDIVARAFEDVVGTFERAIKNASHGDFVGDDQHDKAGGQKCNVSHGRFGRLGQ